MESLVRSLGLVRDQASSSVRWLLRKRVKLELIQSQSLEGDSYRQSASGMDY